VLSRGTDEARSTSSATTTCNVLTALAAIDSGASRVLARFSVPPESIQRIAVASQAATRRDDDAELAKGVQRLVRSARLEALEPPLR
jgi:hypothetical protein